MANVGSAGLFGWIMTVDKEKSLNAPKVSIVVPMYNVEKYIAQCEESLTHQTLEDIEIVLVDDGSPDHCGELADEYARKDNRIKVVHRTNGGLGPARNSGIEAATGEYIGFVDGDDWVMPEMYEKLYFAAKANNADIVCGGHCTYRNGIVVQSFVHQLADNILRDHGSIMKVRKNLYGHKLGDIETKSFPVTVWSNIYKRAYLLANGLRFQNILSEDTIFNLAAFKQANCIVFSARTDYCYRKDGQASITRSFSPAALTKSEQFIKTLNDSALKETSSDRSDCLMRVRYAAVEYTRLHVCLICQSELSKEEKRIEMTKLVESPLFKEFASEYPFQKLQPYQRCVQASLLHRHLNFALTLVGLRIALGELRSR